MSRTPNETFILGSEVSGPHDAADAIENGCILHHELFDLLFAAHTEGDGGLEMLRGSLPLTQDLI